MHDVRIWIRKRQLKPKCKCRGPCRCKEKHTYHLRWLDSATGGWRSKKIGTDRKVAEREAAVLEKQLQDGTFQSIRRIGWAEFGTEHVRLIPGKANAREARHALGQFGEVCGVTRPDRVTFGTVETFVDHLRANGDSVATQNKKLRYLRAAFGKAIKRSYIAKNPMNGWRFAKAERKPPRIVTDAEEVRLLEAAKDVKGYQWWAFIFVALRLGARRGELLSLRWGDVDFDLSRVLFTETKGHTDRYVPLNVDVLTVFRRLQAMTLKVGGPFITSFGRIHESWNRIRTAAGLPDVTIHDLRRTFVTRLVRAGVPLPSVQNLAGHANIQTTLEYYNWVNDDDLRAGIARLSANAAG